MNSFDETEFSILTSINLASLFGELGKQCRLKSERGVWSGSALFAYKNFDQKWKWKITPDTP